MTLEDLAFDYPSPATVNVTTRRARVEPDPERQRRNRRNKANGRGTSRDLAAFLGGRNVELLGLPWDVEARGCRVQSKRDQAGCGPTRAVGLLDHIGDASDDLAVVFHVAPRARLTSGRTYIRLANWVGEHGWKLPPDARLHAIGPLIELPLTTFRDVHIGRTDQ